MEHFLEFGLSIVTAASTGIIGYLVYRLKKHDEERESAEEKRLADIIKREQAITEALQGLCHDRILQGYRYNKRHSGISSADLETMTKLYNAYHALGGNGTITAVHDKILQLPIKDGE